jgi:epsilon-lactone hydrolase
MPSAAHEAMVQRLVASGIRTPESAPHSDEFENIRLAEVQVAPNVPALLRVEQRRYGSAECLDVWRRGNESSPTIVFFHGGGYIWSSPWTHLTLVDGLLKATNGRCTSVHYRRAPEHPFPAAVDDAVAAYRGLIGTGLDPAKTLLAGESAGGGLALATLIALRDAGDPMPAGAFCFSPWTDLTVSGMSAHSVDDPVVSGNALRMMASLYLGDTDPTAPLASPLFGELAGLPPLLVQVGTREALLDDSRRFVKKAQDAGVDVEFIEHVDVIHMWVVFGSEIPESVSAFDSAGSFVRRVIGS